MDYNGLWEIAKSVLMKKKKKMGTQGIKKNICTIVIIIVQYLDNIIKIIFPKFKTLVTSITGKVIHDSGKKPCFEIINGTNNRWTRDTNVTVVVCMMKVVLHSKKET